ncbi:MAG: hypothetical protein K2X71_05525 [Methylobacterium sp.]|uniref:hypothetical protein n=1 Tax=Methylobacterium sp. TaxID=409 RepID=UPI0025845D0A|nr:hypothetical protein [Methylobacterium sp.]MBY0295482.1 hypothetical protein [Methylobacterium sp.]
MSLRLNLAIASLSAFGVVSVCAVSAVQLERNAAAPRQVAAAPAPVRPVPGRPAEEPVATGAISPAPLPPAKPKAQAKADPKRDPAFDSERLAALLSAAAAGTAKPVGR